jgi:hypothetical protein
MKRIMQKITGTYLALIIILVITTLAWAATNYLPQYHNQGTIGSQAKQWAEGHFKAIYSRDASGNLDFYVPSDRVVYITQPSQLSTWSGQAATAGQSYYQTEPGKTYIVDPHAIASYGCAPGGTTAMGTFSGVSLILPNAAIYEGPAYDVTIMLSTTGATGYAVALTGNTAVFVWPFAGSTGLTAYGKTPATYATSYRSACTPQTLHTVYTTNGTTGTNRVASGVSYWEIDKLNENATFGLENGSVSAFVKNRYIVN